MNKFFSDYTIINKIKSIYLFLLLVLNVVLIIFIYICYTDINLLKDEVTSKVCIIDNKSDLPPSLLSQTTLILTIITVGITLFTLFGGFLSLINILNSRKLEKAMESIDEISKHEIKIKTLYYMNQAYNYIHREKVVYAKKCFEKMQELNKDNNYYYLIASFELIQLDFDNHHINKLEKVYIENTSNKLKDLLHALDKLKDNDIEDIFFLKSEIQLLRGCLYGKYAENCKINSERNKSLKNSIEFFIDSQKYYPYDVNILKNILISYLLKDDTGKVIECLTSKRQEIIEKEPFSESMLADKSLSEFLEPYQDKISENMKNTLSKHDINL